VSFGPAGRTANNNACAVSSVNPTKAGLEKWLGRQAISKGAKSIPKPDAKCVGKKFLEYFEQEKEPFLEGRSVGMYKIIRMTKTS